MTIRQVAGSVFIGISSNKNYIYWQYGRIFISTAKLTIRHISSLVAVYFGDCEVEVFDQTS